MIHADIDHGQDRVYVEMIKDCTKKKDFLMGIRLHAHVQKRGLIERSPYIASTLINMYAKCDTLSKAEQVFEGTHERDVVTWNSLISGYVQKGQYHGAFKCFHRMQREGQIRDGVTFTCILNACSSTRAVGKGKQIHSEISSQGLLKTNIVLGNALVDMYAKCGLLHIAHEVFEELPNRNVISWSSLLAGYVLSAETHKAIKCFDQMQREGIVPNEVTYACILKICANTEAIEIGKKIHEEILTKGFLKDSIILGNALVDMYAKCGQLTKAQQVLEDLSLQNTVSWSALIAGYAREGHGHKALESYDRMQREGIYPDEVMFSCILKACSIAGAIEKGKRIHNDLVSRDLLKKNIILGNALVDLYAKCGALGRACQVLEDLPVRNVVSWSSLISGYAHKGQGSEALTCLSRMLWEGLSPDHIIFLCILNACTNLGKPDKAYTYFGAMYRTYGILPNIEHQTCMVAAFASKGYFEKAMSLIETMPPADSLSAWLAVLVSCKRWGNVKLGRQAFNQAIRLDNNLSTAYTLMLEIYAMAGMLGDARMVMTLQRCV